VTAYDPSQWTELFVASAGASAALTGLVFVAVSINIDRILRLAGVPERALVTLLLLLGVLVVSLVALVPELSRTALGLLLLGQALIWTVAVAAMGYRSMAGLDHRAWLVSRSVPLALGTVPFVIGGLSVLAEAGGGLYWTSAGIVGATLAAVLTAWVLLVEILR
jgi:modulator of FtsH protease